MTTKTRDLSNSADIIDSRDVIARIDELQSERDDLTNDLDNADDAYATLADDATIDDRAKAIFALQGARDALKEWTDDNGAELATLLALADDGEGYGDWRHGETLIRDSYFADYAQELAEDCGDYDSRNAKWPYTCIDWEKAASALQQDYTSLDFDGVTYWMRS